MTELDFEYVSRKLNSLEYELRRLRESVRPYLTAPAGGEAGKHPYVEVNPDVLSGEPIIAGTRTPVRAIVEHWKFGDAPETIQRKLPHLRLAQIFDALGYYDDHRDEIDAYIALNRVPVDD